MSWEWSGLNYDAFMNWARENGLAPKELTGWSDNNAENWLYHSETWDENDFKLFNVLYGLPFAKNYIDYLYDTRAAQEYKDRYDITSVHDPRKLINAGSSGQLAVTSLNFVSHNLHRLYK